MYQPSGTGVSNYISTFNTAFYFTVGVSLFLLFALTAAMLYFVFRYNRKRNPVATQIEGNLFLEILWTGIPIILAMVMFYYGWVGWTPTSKPPKDGLTVTTVARMWNFTFVYGNGKQSPDLLVPVGSPVKINLVSLDVIHSLFIPEFRIKSDIMPGRSKIMWFIPQIEGKYKIFCAEYCGLQHSFMHATVNVVSKDKFDKWYADTSRVVSGGGGTGPGAAGEAIMRTQGCFACHTTDGTKLVGPSYLNLYGSQQVVVRNGQEVTITADDAYIKRSILDPGAEVTRGFPNGLMQSYRASVTDADIQKIIEFLKTVNDK